MKAKSYAAFDANSPLKYYEFERREPTEHDVVVEIEYSGVCHSDIHTAKGDWGDTPYPCVPGHEIIGVVKNVGSKVSKFEIGQKVGVGVIVNSCRKCEACQTDYEQYCENGPVYTYGAEDPLDDSYTKGGYSSSIVTHEDFVVNIPENLDSSKAAPLLCAGITMYSPLRHWNVKSGMKVAIIGLGGLGHMGVKYAVAMGAEVWVITTSPDKAKDAKKYGATGVIISTNDDDIEKNKRKFDLIIDTIPVEHSLTPYLKLLNINATIVLVGPINPMPGYHGGQVIDGRKSIAGSGIGSMKELQEMINFSADHNILPDVEMIKIEDINEAWDDLVNKGISHRYVIDMNKSFGL